MIIRDGSKVVLYNRGNNAINKLNSTSKHLDEHNKLWNTLLNTSLLLSQLNLAADN